MVGSEQSIIVENNGMAHTENFSLVAAPGLIPRDLQRVMITGHNGRHLLMQVAPASAASSQAA
jgi:threonylcarbamoyladenosine tRNA methylthiotransferase MtaB